MDIYIDLRYDHAYLDTRYATVSGLDVGKMPVFTIPDGPLGQFVFLCQFGRDDVRILTSAHDVAAHFMTGRQGSVRTLKVVHNWGEMLGRVMA